MVKIEETEPEKAQRESARLEAAHREREARKTWKRGRELEPRALAWGYLIACQAGWVHDFAPELLGYDKATDTVIVDRPVSVVETDDPEGPHRHGLHVRMAIAADVDETIERVRARFPDKVAELLKLLGRTPA